MYKQIRKGRNRMNEFKKMANAAGKTIDEKMEAAKEYRTELEKNLQFNFTKQNELNEQAKTRYDNKISEMLRSLSVVVGDLKDMLRISLEEKFTMNLSEVDAITLVNLASIPLSEDELRLQFKKYKNNPLVLRRLEVIAREKGFDIIELAKEFLGNNHGFEYYVTKIDEFVDNLQVHVDEAIAINPKMTEDEGKGVIVNLTKDVINSLALDYETIFEPVR